MIVPLVSVVIPCFNNARYVGSAIESVLDQDVAGVEVIVVDDGSRDGSADRVEAFEQVLLLRQDNLGSGAARNRGTAAATGEFLAFLDSDDLWAPGKLRAQLDLIAQPEVDIVYSRIEEFVTDDLTDEEAAHLTARPGRPAVLLPSTVLMRRTIAHMLGGFESGTGASESIDWALRVHEAGLVTACAPDALVYRRIHSTNTSRVQRETQRTAYLEAIKRSLDRRRTAGEAAP